MVSNIAAAILVAFAGLGGAVCAQRLTTDEGRREAKKWTALCAFAFAMAPLGIFFLYERSTTERADGYLWNSPAAESDKPALFYRLGEAEWPVRVHDGELLYGDGKRVPPGSVYYGEHPPHLRDDSEPPADPRF